MAWIESHQELSRHPKTKRLARRLDDTVRGTVGLLHMLWWWAMDYAPDGNLTRYESEDIADAVMWDGDPDTLINALVEVGFIDDGDDGLYIHDWNEYAGRLIDKREQNAERKRKSRERQKPVTRTSRGQAQDDRESHRATVPNQTKPNQTKPNPTEPNDDMKVTQVTYSNTAEGEVAATTDQSSSSVHDPRLAQIAKAFESEGFGQLSPMVRDKLVALLEDYDVEWIKQAMLEAITHGVRTMAYVESCLMNWRKAGRITRGEKPGRSRSREPAKNEEVDPRYSKFYELFPSMSNSS